ncbi:MAG: UDP-2,3-diacylglucosamine diphosphatase [Bacteroidetes bacterium]|nr:UDP-2,3-diacylglucosamine diphosphatase [Bacteroidota bacterium]
MKIRNVEIAVLSDIHLGTYGCHAKEVLAYLDSINPKTLILNGDIIDIWQFSKKYWPKAHMEVINKILKIAENGTQVYYLTGNHDELLRKFSGFHMGNLHLDDKLVLTLGDKKAWFFHGDVFDVTMQHSKWLAKLGGKGYDLLIVLNRAINFLLVKLGKERISFSKKIKNSVKEAIKFISDFEKTATNLAIENNFDYVVCGHIHQPIIRECWNEKGSVVYLNSGDWVENLTCLEYDKEEWNLMHFSDLNLSIEKESKTLEIVNDPLFEILGKIRVA